MKQSEREVTNMSGTAEIEALADQLEDMVDTVDLHAVLEALASICYAKADHLRTNWQDVSTARM